MLTRSRQLEQQVSVIEINHHRFSLSEVVLGKTEYAMCRFKLTLQGIDSFSAGARRENVSIFMRSESGNDCSQQHYIVKVLKMMTMHHS